MRTQYRSEELNPLDGPTEQFRQHTDITDRANVPGKKIFSKVEQLLRGNYIQPEHSEAGRRFTDDYLKGVVGRSRSCIDIDISGGGGDGMPSLERLEASGRFKAAAVALAESKGPTMPGGTSADLLVIVCVENCAFSQVALRAGVSDEVVKSWIAQLLAVLAGHYARVDRVAGKSSTVYTKEIALKKFDPEVK